MEILDAFNAWIESHQALVVSVAVPILTVLLVAIFGFFSNRASLQAQKLQRRLDIELQICQFRQSWINSLRDDLASAGALAFLFDEDKSDDELRVRLTELFGQIRMRINPEDPDDNALRMAIAKALGNFDNIDIDQEDIETVPEVGGRILKREWERLKRDLKKIDGHNE